MNLIDNGLIQGISKHLRKDYKIINYCWNSYSFNIDIQKGDVTSKRLLTGIYKELSSEYYPVQFSHSNLINFGRYNYIKLLDNTNKIIRYLYFIESIYVNSNFDTHFITVNDRFLNFDSLMMLRSEIFFNMPSACYELNFYIKRDLSIDKSLFLYQLIGEHIFEFYFMSDGFHINIKKIDHKIHFISSFYSRYDNLESYKSFVSKFIYDFYVYPKIGIDKKDFNLDCYNILKIYNI